MFAVAMTPNDKLGADQEHLLGVLGKVVGPASGVTGADEGPPAGPHPPPRFVPGEPQRGYDPPPPQGPCPLNLQLPPPSPVSVFFPTMAAPKCR